MHLMPAVDDVTAGILLGCQRFQEREDLTIVEKQQVGEAGGDFAG